MRAVIQRVSRASVSVEGEVVGAIGPGMLILAGAGAGDSIADVSALAAKLGDLRIFPDGDGRFNRSLRDVGGAALVVSQFTLYGDVKRGRRPSFTAAAPPDIAEPLIEALVDALAADGFEVAAGRFGAMMDVDLCNEGPFTVIVETADGRVVGLDG